jgi:hypothetical protein
MKATYGLKVVKSSTGYYVGTYFQEDEAITFIFSPLISPN